MKCRAAKRKHLDTFVIMHSGCETPNQRLLESQHGKFVGRSLVNPYWIKTEGVRLAIIPRPRGQDWLPDDISLLQRTGIDVYQRSTRKIAVWRNRASQLLLISERDVRV